MNNKTLWSIVGVTLLVVIALLLFGVISIPTTVITPDSAETSSAPDSAKKIAEKQSDGGSGADQIAEKQAEDPDAADDQIAEKQAEDPDAADDQIAEKVEFKIVE